LLRLPAEIKRDIVEERLSMGHARALLALDAPDQITRAREEIIKGRLTVRAAETLVKRLKANRPAKQPKAVDPHLTDLVEQLKRHFQAKVAIRRSGRGGKVEISFADQDDLGRIIDIINH
jgi:ParB family chromosome partitioning protein